MRLCNSCAERPAVTYERYREGTKYLCERCALPPSKPKPLGKLRRHKPLSRTKRHRQMYTLEARDWN